MKIFVTAGNCTGCRTCEIVCSLNNNKKILLNKSNIQIIKSDLNGRRVDVPFVCRNCERAPCARVCDRGAIRATGKFVVLDSNLCDGCGKCIEICPFGSIFRIEKHGITKCNFCNGQFLCVKFCATGAIRLEE